MNQYSDSFGKLIEQFGLTTGNIWGDAIDLSGSEIAADTTSKFAVLNGLLNGGNIFDILGNYASDVSGSMNEYDKRMEESTKNIEDLANDTVNKVNDISEKITSQVAEKLDKLLEMIRNGITIYFNNSETSLGIAKASVGSAASGGYINTSGSGIDGRGGKYMVVHPNELVVNSDQIETLMSGVDILNEMKQMGLNSIFDFAKVGSNIKLAGNDTIEQRVQIDATFPSAENAAEIKSALLSLADNAYQYANRYK